MRRFKARVIGRPRSQRDARAVREFVGYDERAGVIERLDAVYADGESASGLDDSLAALQSLSLPAKEGLNKTFPSAAQGCAARFDGVSH